MPLNILDLVLFGQQEKLILCLESKIRLTISIVFYTKDIVFVAVTTLVKQLEIQEQDLVNKKSSMENLSNQNISKTTLNMSLVEMY